MEFSSYMWDNSHLNFIIRGEVSFNFCWTCQWWESFYLSEQSIHSICRSLSFGKLFSCFVLVNYNVMTALQVLKPFWGAPILPGLPFLAFQAQACGLVPLWSFFSHCTHFAYIPLKNKFPKILFLRCLYCDWYSHVGGHILLISNANYQGVGSGHYTSWWTDSTMS